jgi:hypothetical protein
MGRKHGQSNSHGTKRCSLTYNTWRGMKERCLNENHLWYDSYGGRGITIDPRWLGKDGFNNFLLDMGERPGKAMTLDRIEVNGNYTNDNCRWAPKTLQRANLRRPQ